MLRDIHLLEKRFNNKMFSDNWKLILNNKLQMNVEKIKSDALSITFYNRCTCLKVDFNKIIDVKISDYIYIYLIDQDKIKIVFR